MSALRVVKDEDAPPYDGQEAHKPHFAMLYECVLFDERLNSSAIRLYAVLQRYVGEYGAHRLFPSHQELATYSNMNRDTVSDALAKLEQCGHITRKSRGFGEPKLIVIAAPKPFNRGENPRCGSFPHTEEMGSENPPYAENFRSGKVPHTVRKTSATDAENFRKNNRSSNRDVIENERDTTTTVAQPLPPDFTLTPRRLAFATDRDWNERRTRNEFDKFCNRNREREEVAKNWDAKWRTWVLQGVSFDIRDGKAAPKPADKGFKPGTPEWAAATGKAVL